MRTLLALIALVSMATGCLFTEAPYDGELSEVNINVEGYEGPVSLLLSGPDGRFVGVVYAMAPTQVTENVPVGGSVSTRFNSTLIYSIAGLRRGQDVTLRPFFDGPPRQRLLTIEPIADLAPHTVRVDTGCGGWAEISEEARVTVEVNCRADPLIVGFERVAQNGDVLGVAIMTVTATQGDIIHSPPLRAYTSQLDMHRMVLGNWSDRESGVTVGLRGIRGEHRLGAATFSKTIGPSQSPDTTIGLFPIDFDAFEARASWLAGNDWFDLTQIAMSRPVEIDLTPTLPRFVDLVADDYGVSWESESGSAGIDLAILSSEWYEDGATYNQAIWMVAVSPEGRGTWLTPEIPDELSRWRPTNTTFTRASLGHYDFGDVSSPDTLYNDPFARPNTPVEIGEQRRMVHSTGIDAQ